MKGDGKIVARIIIGIALVGALALVLWLWFSAGSRTAELIVGAHGSAGSTQPNVAASEPLQVESKTEIEGELRARTPESPAPQEPALSQDLRVRVVDPAGEPVADVPLRLIPGREAKPAPDHAGLRASRTTDVEGYALFSEVRSILAASQDASPGEQWNLVCEIPFENSPVVKLDRSKLELPLVVATIPFSGVVDVHVRELDGKDAKDGSSVELRLLLETDLASPLTPGDRQTSRAETHTGLAHFPCVELGRTWELLASRHGSSIRTRVRAPGPVKPRTHVLIEVVLGADHPVVVFRAVDEQRSPLRHVTLEIKRNDGMFGFGDQSNCETDEAGRFTVELENVRGPRRFSDLLVTYHADDHRTFFGRPTINKALEPGLSDGGDVVLAPEPILAEGLVQDLSGQPVSDAEICVGTGQRRLQMGFGDSSDVRGTSDAHGHFELHGLVTNGAFDLWTTKGELSSTKMRAHEGQRGIVLTLSAFYTVFGRFLLDDGVESYRIAAEFVDAEHSTVRAELQHRPPEGSFTLAPIPAGVYDIAWSYNSARLAELDKLVVTKNVDVGAIDLRGRLHRYDIVLLGAPPSSKLTGEFAWRPSGSQEKWNNEGFNKNPIAFFTLTSPVDVWVRPNGYRGDVLFGVVGRTEMSLVAPLRVHLELHTTGQLPKFPYILFVDLQQDGVTVGQRTNSQSFTDENRSLTYDVSAPGRMRVRWHLEWHSDSGARGGNVLSRNELEIQVADIPGEQVFTIELDGDALTKLTTKPPF